MNIQIIRLPKVFHVGTLDPANLGANSGGASLEGACLSVSLCPNAWSAIVKIGDGLHELRNEGGTFLDISALLGDEASKAELIAWGKENGYARLRKLWRSWRYDGEADEWRFLLCRTAQEALEEARAYDDEAYPSPADVPAPDGHKGIEPEAVSIGTAKLRRLTGHALRPDEDASDALAVAFAMVRVPEQTGIELDGVWWREAFDPALLSAPRGGIFPDRVKLWAAIRADLLDVDDDLELGEMPESEPLETVVNRPV
ncbi:hypothetical protein ACVIGB_000784 [Bradyrhizobium sp. USDA 4341]